MWSLEQCPTGSWSAPACLLWPHCCSVWRLQVRDADLEGLAASPTVRIAAAVFLLWLVLPFSLPWKAVLSLMVVGGIVAGLAVYARESCSCCSLHSTGTAHSCGLVHCWNKHCMSSCIVCGMAVASAWIFGGTPGCCFPSAPMLPCREPLWAAAHARPQGQHPRQQCPPVHRRRHLQQRSQALLNRQPKEFAAHPADPWGPGLSATCLAITSVHPLPAISL